MNDQQISVLKKFNTIYNSNKRNFSQYSSDDVFYLFSIREDSLYTFTKEQNQYLNNLEDWNGMRNSLGEELACFI